MIVSCREPVTASSTGSFPFAARGAAQRTVGAAVAIGFEHREHRWRQRRQRLTVDDGALVGCRQPHVQAIAAARLVERANQLRHSLRLRAARCRGDLRPSRRLASATSNCSDPCVGRESESDTSDDLLALVVRSSTLTVASRPARGRSVSSHTRSIRAVRDCSVASMVSDRLSRHRPARRRSSSRNVSGPATYAASAAGRLIARKDVLERDIAVLANRRRAAYGERRGPGVALVAREHVRDREIGEERRERVILAPREVERAARRAIGIERDAHRDHRRTGPRRPATAVARSCCTVPTTSPKLAILLDGIRLGSTTCTSALRQRKLRRSEVVHRMAERRTPDRRRRT